jgi:general secretion pathway protein G
MVSMNKVNEHQRVARRAFTLLEVLLVIVILVTLAAVVVPNLTGAKDQADKGTTQTQISGIESALDMFKMNIGRYPTTEEGLGALYDKDQIQDDDLVKKWNGPYLGKGDSDEKSLKDAWNHEFRYTCPGEHNTKSFDLSSDGPDGEEGTEDDIVNWKEDKD